MAPPVMIGCHFALRPDWLPAKRIQSRHRSAGIGQGSKLGGRRRNGAGRSPVHLLVQDLLLPLGYLSLISNRNDDREERRGEINCIIFFKSNGLLKFAFKLCDRKNQH